MNYLSLKIICGGRCHRKTQCRIMYHIGSKEIIDAICKSTHMIAYMCVYLSGNWWKQFDQNDRRVSLREELLVNGVSLYDWGGFKDLSYEDNAVSAIDAIKNCNVYAAVLDSPQHRYTGTLELMCAAIALGKKVLIYVGVPECHSTLGPITKRWTTDFDRYVLYHPSVKIYTQDQFSQFCMDLINYGKR